jgi:hypothetical protein
VVRRRKPSCTTLAWLILRDGRKEWEISDPDKTETRVFREIARCNSLIYQRCPEEPKFGATALKTQNLC